MNLSDNAKEIARSRYFWDDEQEWDDLADRICRENAKKESDVKKRYEEFYSIIEPMDFIPAGRILRNLGKLRPSTSNCNFLPLEDSIESIGDTLRDYLIISSYGGGNGIDFSSLRPKGAPLITKTGVSSGLVSFMEIFNYAGERIETGGQRRSAGIALCHISHPEIREFINAKVKHNKLTQFNISVIVDSSFLKAVEEDNGWDLKFAGKVYETVRARELWDMILNNMLEHSEPGLINWDNLRKNNTYYFSPVRGVNPSLRKGTKVLTKTGIFPIEELQDTNFKTPNILGTYSDAACFLSGKNKRLYKIILQGNHEIYATAEHEWPIVSRDKWKYELNDFIKKRTDEIVDGDYLPQSSKKESLPFGSSGDYEDGFLIGWNIGDGWISNNDRPAQIGFIVSEKDQEFNIHKRLSAQLIKRCNWKGEFRPRTSGFTKAKNIEVNVQNKKLRQLFNKFGVTKKELGIPTSIWSTASEEFRRGFIDALFSSDGCISNNRISLSSSRYKLALDISELLGFYGIQSSVKHTTYKDILFPNGKTYDKTYHRYEVCINRQSSILHFNNIFSLSNTEKQEKINMISKECKFIAPSNGIKIISIEKTDIYEDVWDITVFDDIHIFELNQVLTGNCGELPLEEYGCCNLGALVLPHFIVNKNTNWQKLSRAIKIAVRFMDNVIDLAYYPIPQQEMVVKNARRIGLGTMGLADYFFMKEIRYGSDKALAEIEKLYRFIRDEVYIASVELAKEKGAFPKYNKTDYGSASFVRKLPAKIRMYIKENSIRNATLLTAAPTGTTSLLADVTSGIEPLPFKGYLRSDRVGERIYIHPLCKDHYNADWFVDSYDLKPEEHLEMQSAIGKYLDGSVSKTILLPEYSTVSDLSAILLEYIYDLKGVTVYRDKSRKEQVYYKLSTEQIEEYINNSNVDTHLSEDDVKCSSGYCEL
jgi:ribonucleoside-diphosphate reductase alpha chain